MTTRCRLFCQDWTDTMNMCNDGEVDLVLTDPPYLISRRGEKVLRKRNKPLSHDFGDWDRLEWDVPRFARETWRVLRDGGTAIIFYDIWKMQEMQVAMKAQGFDRFHLLLWHNPNPIPLNAKAFYLDNGREGMLVCMKGKNPTFNYAGRYHAGDFYKFGTVPHNQRMHPTQKPLELMQELCWRHSSTDDLVLDPFMGSGTTALAAVNGRRRFIGGDSNLRYATVARHRILTPLEEQNE